MPKRFVSQAESVVSTDATLMRGSPLASRDAASWTASLSHVASTLVQRETLALQNLPSQSPEVAPVAACVKCSKLSSCSSITARRATGVSRREWRRWLGRRVGAAGAAGGRAPLTPKASGSAVLPPSSGSSAP